MIDRNNEKSKPDLISPHGGYRNLKSYRTYIESSPPEVAANTLTCLIHQANYLLDQQLRQLGKQFLEEGGFTKNFIRCANRLKENYNDHP